MDMKIRGRISAVCVSALLAFETPALANDVAKARLGKHFCYIKHSVGIQYSGRNEFDLSKEPFAGKIRPKDDKFFLEIIRNFTLNAVRSQPWIASVRSKKSISYAQSLS
jgi:hypothetical protein